MSQQNLELFKTIYDDRAISNQYVTEELIYSIAEVMVRHALLFDANEGLSEVDISFIKSLLDS